MAALIESKFDHVQRDTILTVKKETGESVALRGKDLTRRSLQMAGGLLTQRRLADKQREDTEKQSQEHAAQEAAIRQREQDFKAVFPDDVIDQNKDVLTSITRWISTKERGEQGQYAYALLFLKDVVHVYSLEGGLDRDADPAHVKSAVSNIADRQRSQIEELLRSGGADGLMVKVRGRELQSWEQVWQASLRLQFD